MNDDLLAAIKELTLVQRELTLAQTPRTGMYGDLKPPVATVLGAIKAALAADA